MSRDAAGAKGNERAYAYGYDALERYTGSAYAERSSGTTGTFNLNVDAFNEDNITYTESGNILTLKRNMKGSTSPTPIDDLTYTYDTNNPGQLKTVTDGTGTNYTGFGFRNLTGSTTGTYTYDANGNLTADPYKALTLDYNILNRADKITITSATGRYINYTYDAGGQLIRKQAYDNNTLQTTTDYIDGYVYENSTLSYFPMPEGRIRNTGTGGTVTLKAEYIITDQQGNARLSLEENDTQTGVAVIRQENSFYGFGLVMPGSPTVTPATNPNKQLYNGGSEWQNDFSDLPDYYQTFFRNYDAALGRWVGVDPMAEAADALDTYQYAGNNPICFNDPLGDFTPPHYNLEIPRKRRRMDPGPPGALPDYIPYGLHDSYNDYQGMAADQAFDNFVNNAGNPYGNDLLRAARSGDPNAVAEYVRMYGTEVYNISTADPATRDAQLAGIQNGQFNGDVFSYAYTRRGAADPESTTGYDIDYSSVTVNLANQGGGRPSDSWFLKNGWDSAPWYGNFRPRT